MWCSDIAYKNLMLEIESHSYAPAQSRVFGTLVNTPEFAEAFNCPVGKKL